MAKHSFASAEPFSTHMEPMGWKIDAELPHMATMW
jgi:hypothetical protein